MLKRASMFLLLFVFVAAAPRPTAVTYGVDVNHSTVGFSVPILGGLSRVTGKFMDFTININYDEADVTKSSVNTIIKAASVNTGIDRRDNHLRSADFFEVEKYPEITFQSKRVEKKGKGLVAVGDFTMHGVTKEVALPITISGVYKDPASGKITLGFSARMPLNRLEYGIAYKNKQVPTFLGDVVEVQIDLVTKASDGK
jgi:polyisoprenoid-binding protein YceI